MFYGANFMYGGKMSEEYGIKIINFQKTSGTTTSPAGNEVEIIEKRIYRRPISYHFGNSPTTPLTFTLEVGYSDFVSAIDRSNVEKWLLGQTTYKKFQVDQSDVAEIFWNVIFTSAEIIYVGRKQIGMLLYAQADAPWAHTFDQSFNYDFTPDAVQSFDFTFFNSSDNNNYLYPTIEFTLNSLGSDFTLTNTTDDSRQFIFTGLSANEGITVNNSLQIIESTTGLYRLSYFNKNWFRFLPGLNSLHITSAISLVEFTYSFARAVGG